MYMHAIVSVVNGFACIILSWIRKMNRTLTSTTYDERKR